MEGAFPQFHPAAVVVAEGEAFLQLHRAAVEEEEVLVVLQRSAVGEAEEEPLNSVEAALEQLLVGLVQVSRLMAVVGAHLKLGLSEVVTAEEEVLVYP